MSKIESNEDFTTKLRNETFLHFADNSTMGIIIIQRGHLKYFNEKFSEIFGYTQKEIQNWRKREFYKIIHPEDLSHLVEYFRVENDKKTVSLRFRGIKKDRCSRRVPYYHRPLQ